MITRRSVLQYALAAVVKKPEIRHEVFLPSPGKGTAVMAYAYYTTAHTGDMMSVEQRLSRSDTVDVAYYRYSKDYGRKWSEPQEQITGAKTTGGMYRRAPRGAWVDPHNGKLVEFWLDATLPTDDPLEGLRRWNIFYRIAGGESRQLIHRGAEYNPAHPLPGVYSGKNCAMIGDQPSYPISSDDATILLPIDITPLDADGNMTNPGGGYTYHDTAVLRGRWKDENIEWQMSDLVVADPARTTRGLSEPTIAMIDRNAYILVMRGSNDKKPDLPSHRWISYSSDGGNGWTEAKPWTYHDGTPFFSPSSCSQLVKHSSGRLFWLGNITPENPKGNRPRYPFVIGEVDRGSGLLIREKVRTIDTLQKGEDPVLSLSNFFAREDRQTKEICVHMTRLFARDKAWEGDAMLYRIPISVI